MHEKVDFEGIEVIATNTDQLAKVSQALTLIRDFDPIRFTRLRRELRRIWVRGLSGGMGEYRHDISTCALSVRYLERDEMRVEEIASIIVHEATHARLENTGFQYVQENRLRIEHICFRRELAFGRKLPNGAAVIVRAEGYLASGYTFSDEEMEEWSREGGANELRYLGCPEWLIVIVRAMRDMRGWLRGPQ